MPRLWGAQSPLHRQFMYLVLSIYHLVFITYQKKFLTTCTLLMLRMQGLLLLGLLLIYNGGRWDRLPNILYPMQKGPGSFHIHRKTMKELCALAVLGIWEQPNLAKNIQNFDFRVSFKRFETLQYSFLSPSFLRIKSESLRLRPIFAIFLRKHSDGLIKINKHIF